MQEAKNKLKEKFQKVPIGVPEPMTPEPMTPDQVPAAAAAGEGQKLGQYVLRGSSKPVCLNFVGLAEAGFPLRAYGCYGPSSIGEMHRFGKFWCRASGAN